MQQSSLVLLIRQIIFFILSSIKSSQLFPFLSVLIIYLFFLGIIFIGSFVIIGGQTSIDFIEKSIFIVLDFFNITEDSMIQESFDNMAKVYGLITLFFGIIYQIIKSVVRKILPIKNESDAHTKLNKIIYILYATTFLASTFLIIFFIKEYIFIPIGLFILTMNIGFLIWYRIVSDVVEKILTRINTIFPIDIVSIKN